MVSVILWEIHNDPYYMDYMGNINHSIILWEIHMKYGLYFIRASHHNVLICN
jgi:hypothetical protein